MKELPNHLIIMTDENGKQTPMQGLMDQLKEALKDE
jgi:hypothetical protein